MNAIRFNLNGTPRAETEVTPSTTVLDWLRAQRLTGTKEGCAEGDCGACTIVLDHGTQRSPRYQAVNSCLMLMPQLDGLDVVTVEGIAQNGELHPVQKLLIETDGTQCGFCTPGFVMAMYALSKAREPRDEAHIHEALAGNLCRCTGYRAIVDACKEIPLPAHERKGGATAERRQFLKFTNRAQLFVAPDSLAEILELRASNPDAIVWAGGTDLGLRASKGREHFPLVLSTANLPELKHVDVASNALVIGGAATYTDALPLIDKHFPSFGALVRRIGSRQVRNLGTFAGNLVTASPIGDTIPALMALGAEVQLASRRGARALPVEQFVTGYRKTALGADEIVTTVLIPLLPETARFETYKISKRFDQDISAVVAAFYRYNGSEPEIRVVYGGMAERVKRAASAEALLASSEPPSPAAIEAAMAKDFAPLSDHRAGAAYRLRAAAGLAQRFLVATSTPLRIEAL
jgi:xanthine dehydrogenase small subunit